MDSGSLRALALEINLSAHGVPATITRPSPDDTPIETTGIWEGVVPIDYPRSGTLQRNEPKRVFAIPTADVPTVPRGTIILAPLRTDLTPERWRVDATDRVDVDHVRVIVIPDPESS